MNDTDKVLFQEIAACYSAKAFRAAYVLVWVNTAESLKRKFYEMSLRDGRMKKEVIRKIEDLERDEKAIDTFLLKAAYSNGLVTQEQNKKLEYIKTMRNIYAHPYESAPEPEHVEAAVRITIDSVLSQPALLKHSFVQTLITQVFENYHYLDDVEETVKSKAITLIGHIHPEVYPYFFTKLVKELEKTSKDPSLDKFSVRGRYFLEAFLDGYRPELSKGIWEIEKLLDECPSILPCTLAGSNIWADFPVEIQDRIIGHLLEPVEDGKITKPSVESATRVYALVKNALTTQRQTDRFWEITKKLSYYQRKQIGFSLNDLYQEIISDMKSYDWYVQKPAVYAVEWFGAQSCDKLTTEEQENLGRNILQAAQGGSNASRDFIYSLHINDGERWPDSFIQGIFYETFINEENQLRFKKNHMKRALLLASRMGQSSQRILENAIELVKVSTLKYKATFASDFVEIVKLVGEVSEKEKNEKIRGLLQKFSSELNNAGQRLVTKEYNDL